MSKEDMNVKNAKLVMKLNAESGYKCTSEEVISANQWRDINLVIAGKLSSEKSEVEALSKP